MCEEYPDMKSKIFGAMQRLPLEGWQPAPAPGHRAKQQPPRARCAGGLGR